MNTVIKIIGICGSLRNNSKTSAALQFALAAAEQAGAEVQLVDLRDYELVFCDGRNQDEYPDDVKRLREAVKNAQGVILGTPEYHGSYSGVLKNALDLMGFEEFEGKMIGLIAISAGALGGNDAFNSLRNVGRSLHAWVVPDQVSIPYVDAVISQSGEINDANVTQRLEHLGRQVARFSFLHSSSKAKAFIKAWEEAPQNPGAK